MMEIELKYDPFEVKTTLTINGEATGLERCFGTGKDAPIHEWVEKFFPELIKQCNLGPGSHCSFRFYGTRSDFEAVKQAHKDYCAKTPKIKIALSEPKRYPQSLYDVLERVVQERTDIATQLNGWIELETKIDALEKKLAEGKELIEKIAAEEMVVSEKFFKEKNKQLLESIIRKSIKSIKMEDKFFFKEFFFHNKDVVDFFSREIDCWVNGLRDQIRDYQYKPIFSIVWLNISLCNFGKIAISNDKIDDLTNELNNLLDEEKKQLSNIFLNLKLDYPPCPPGSRFWVYSGYSLELVVENIILFCSRCKQFYKESSTKIKVCFEDEYEKIAHRIRLKFSDIIDVSLEDFPNCGREVVFLKGKLDFADEVIGEIEALLRDKEE